jgi:hypothetical protein
MSPTIDELLAVVYRHYPRGIATLDTRYGESDEYRHLAAMRRQAGRDAGPWRALLGRLGDRFPEASVENRSTHLPAGTLDAGYSAAIHVPKAPGEHDHAVGFVVSFLVPFYVVYAARIVDDPERASRLRAPSSTVGFAHEDTLCILPAAVVQPAVRAADAERRARLADRARKQVVTFDLLPEELPYAAALAREIEATFAGYAPLPRELGEVVVPDVATPSRQLGEATLYDCLFSDAW